MRNVGLMIMIGTLLLVSMYVGKEIVEQQANIEVSIFDGNILEPTMGDKE